MFNHAPTADAGLLETVKNLKQLYTTEDDSKKTGKTRFEDIRAHIAIAVEEYKKQSSDVAFFAASADDDYSPEKNCLIDFQLFEVYMRQIGSISFTDPRLKSLINKVETTLNKLENNVEKLLQNDTGGKAAYQEAMTYIKTVKSCFSTSPGQSSTNTAPEIK